MLAVMKNGPVGASSESRYMAMSIKVTLGCNSLHLELHTELSALMMVSLFPVLMMVPDVDFLTLRLRLVP